MRISSWRTMLLGSVWLAASGCIPVHAFGPPADFHKRIDIGIAYSVERARLAPGRCGCFWLQGGGIDAGLTVWKGLGVAGSVTAATIGAYAPGVDFHKVAYLVGPRYTYTAGHRLEVFGQGLFGRTHAFESAFPSSTGTKPSASSFAMQTGGGLNLVVSRAVAFRLLEIDYVRTQLPNGYANTQNDFRIGAGVALHFGSAPSR